MPEASKNAPKPWAIPVTYRGETYSVEADGEPFGIERVVDGEEALLFLPRHRSRSEHRGAGERQQLYRTHFGFPNMLVPFFTTDVEHLNNMKALLHKMTDGKGSRTILFGEPYPAFNTFRDPLPPSGHTLITSYERVGHEPFHFLTA